jgi:cytochrome c oxidase subunit III
MTTRPPGGVVLYPKADGDAEAPGATRLGMRLFLVSLSMLFAGALVAFWVVRAKVSDWPPRGAPPLPRILMLSTAFAIGASVTLQGSLVAIRRGNEPGLERRLATALALGIAFLLCQALAWYEFFDRQTFGRHLYAFTFYILTGLHALHVIGGVAALAVVSTRAKRHAYSWAAHAGVRSTAAYWHFLGIVWVVLYATLAVAGRPGRLLG